MSFSPFGADIVTRVATPAEPFPGWLGAADWCWAPLDVTRSGQPYPDGLPHKVAHVISAEPDTWDRTLATRCRDLLASRSLPQLEVCQLDACDRERIKAGEPFRRLQEVRDLGLVRFFGMRVTSPRDARWAMESTPVHVLTLDAPLDEPEWAEIWSLAADLNTGLLATGRSVAGDPLRAAEVLDGTPICAFAWPIHHAGEPAEVKT